MDFFTRTILAICSGENKKDLHLPNPYVKVSNLLTIQKGIKYNVIPVNPVACKMNPIRLK